jgi:hypothetical protein
MRSRLVPVHAMLYEEWRLFGTRWHRTIATQRGRSGGAVGPGQHTKTAKVSISCQQSNHGPLHRRESLLLWITCACLGTPQGRLANAALLALESDRLLNTTAGGRSLELSCMPNKNDRGMLSPACFNETCTQPCPAFARKNGSNAV